MVKKLKTNALSYWLVIAGVLSFGFTIAHITGGGDLVHSPILESELSDELKGFVSVIWHGITASMLLCSCLLLISAWRSLHRMVLSLIVAVNYSLFTAIFLFYGVVRFQSVMVMPQWIGFTGIVLVVLMGLWAEKSTITKVSLS
ncbi:MAG: hypothetical protein ACRBHB_07895 [Arenicella sp.]